MYLVRTYIPGIPRSLWETLFSDQLFSNWDREIVWLVLSSTSCWSEVCCHCCNKHFRFLVFIHRCWKIKFTVSTYTYVVRGDSLRFVESTKKHENKNQPMANDIERKSPWNQFPVWFSISLPTLEEAFLRSVERKLAKVVLFWLASFAWRFRESRLVLRHPKF